MAVPIKEKLETEVRMDKVFFVFPTELLLREIIETIISAEKE